MFEYIMQDCVILKRPETSMSLINAYHNQMLTKMDRSVLQLYRHTIAVILS